MLAGELLEIVGALAVVALLVWAIDYCERVFTEINADANGGNDAQPWGDVIEVPAAAQKAGGATQGRGDRFAQDEIAPHRKAGL
jgi:hypothetical protein